MSLVNIDIDSKKPTELNGVSDQTCPWSLHTLIIYLQVVIWKRVKEFNEELIIRVVCRAIYLSLMALTYLCPTMEKIDIYFFLTGGGQRPINSYVGESDYSFAK